MDEDTAREDIGLGRNRYFSKYNLDTYDDEDDELTSSVSGHVVFKIIAICPAQWLSISTQERCHQISTSHPPRASPLRPTMAQRVLWT